MNEPEKIHILCFGDSNTWGCIGKWEENDKPSDRFDPEYRWPCVLQKELGDGFHIVEEGLGGRTTIYPKPGEEWKSGESYLPACLHSHRPLDLVIIMLGTNDLLVNHDLTEETMGRGIARLVEMIQHYPKTGRAARAPKILLIAPPEIVPSDPGGRVGVYAKFRGDIGGALSKAFPKVYARVAREKECFFLDGQQYAVPGPADGVHITPESHIHLGCAVADYVRNVIFPKR